MTVSCSGRTPAVLCLASLIGCAAMLHWMGVAIRPFVREFSRHLACLPRKERARNSFRSNICCG